MHVQVSCLILSHYNRKRRVQILINCNNKAEKGRRLCGKGVKNSRQCGGRRNDPARSSSARCAFRHRCIELRLGHNEMKDNVLGSGRMCWHPLIWEPV